MNKEEAIKILRELHDKVLFSERTALETLHPELKKSEDEKIRKSLIILLQHFCNGYRVPGLDFPVSYKDMLTWLEKQGEHKKFRDSIQVGDEVTRNSDGVIVNLSQLKRVAKKSEQKLPIEKLPEKMKTIGESLGFTTQEECDEYNQMVSDLIMSDNKVKPKFHEGEWVVFNDKHESVYQIEKIENFQYTLRHILGGSMPLSFSGEDMIRPWTIQDARLGDVLANCNIICIYKKRESEHLIKVYLNYSLAEGVEITDDTIGDFNLYPATKEQRDTLFTKMKEAGYEWDAEKKELKKVEKKSQRMISAEAKEAMYDKPTDNDMVEALRTEYEKGMADAIAQMQKEWSEEDEVKMNRIVACLENLNVADNDILLKDVDWLKSLKDRYTWKPSEKQMNAFEQVYDWYNNNFAPSETLTSLYNDLKKLKEE